MKFEGTIPDLKSAVKKIDVPGGMAVLRYMIEMIHDTNIVNWQVGGNLFKTHAVICEN